jgi:hypothetical protein
MMGGGTSMKMTKKELAALSKQAHRVYEEHVRPVVETEENIGKILVLDVDSGEYEIDDMGIEPAHRLRAKNPNARLYGFRIGYEAGDSFAGALERARPR